MKVLRRKQKTTDKQITSQEDKHEQFWQRFIIHMVIWPDIFHNWIFSLFFSLPVCFSFPLFLFLSLSVFSLSPIPKQKTNLYRGNIIKPHVKMYMNKKQIFKQICVFYEKCIHVCMYICTHIYTYKYMNTSRYLNRHMSTMKNIMYILAYIRLCVCVCIPLLNSNSECPHMSFIWILKSTSL